ncbi:MAG: copper ion binding protein, partial [Turicibacter sp.]
MNQSFKIEGMSCSACANRLEKVMNKLEGVEKATVNFATETLMVHYDESKSGPKSIEEAVVKAGFKIKKTNKTYSFKVEGMTCSACATRVEKVSNKLAGVERASVNFATEKLTITIDEDTVSYAQIKGAVEKAGYKLVKEDEEEKVVKKISESHKLL